MAITGSMQVENLIFCYKPCMVDRVPTLQRFRQAIPVPAGMAVSRRAISAPAPYT